MDPHSCNAHGKYEKCIQCVLLENMKERDHLLNIGVNGNILWKWFLIQYGVSVRIGNVWLSVCSCLYEYDNELQVKRRRDISWPGQRLLGSRRTLLHWQWSFSPLKNSDYTTSFNISKLCMLPTECTIGFVMILRIDGEHFFTTALTDRALQSVSSADLILKVSVL
jgi:hypothetical protein